VNRFHASALNFKGKQALSPDAALMERLVRLERKVDALCRYLLPSTGQYAPPDVLLV
jgi:hypothetical protein